MNTQNKWLNTTVEAYIKYFGVKESPVVYEVGSRDGNDGVELARRISNDKITMKNIVLFECNPPQINVVKTNYPQATLITDAISDEVGEVEFLQIHGDKNMVGSSSMDLSRVNESWVQSTSTIKVKTRRLDDVIKELKHQKTEIDVMKIDIEHYTYEALESLGDYLRNVKVFHLETEPETVARNKTNLDIALYMREKGYKCTALDHEWGDLIQDQVWVRQ